MLRNRPVRPDEFLSPHSHGPAGSSSHSDYYSEEAGYRVARRVLTEFVEAFRFLGRNPGVGHQRQDLAEDRPVLFWPMRDYLIIYKRGSKPLEILTFARGSQDVPQIISRRQF